MSILYEGPDGLQRCNWAGSAPDFVDYHDTEWGFPVTDDKRLFEKVCLEGFQSGLSWRTILSKRENFRKAFLGFDFYKIAKYTDSNVEDLLKNKGIIRHRGKIEAVINNAKLAVDMVEEFGSLAAYFWQFEPAETNNFIPLSRATSPESIIMSKDLKKRGWKFVGPTTVYAFMQAMGLINDHAEGCIIRESVEKAPRSFIRPAKK